MSNLRIKKSLIETKFVAKAEDIPAIKSKMGKDDVVRIVDEDHLPNEQKKSLNNPKIEKFVAQLNDLIRSAVDSDGDPLGVIDTTSTWEEPYIYYPIEYKNGALKITSKSQYKNEPEVEVIPKRNMEVDGVPTLRLIKRMINLAIRRNAKANAIGESEFDREGRGVEYGVEPELSGADWEELYNSMIKTGELKEEGEIQSTGVINGDKLRADVAKFMDKLDLSQFQNVIKKIDKPQEQAEVIAAFAERIGIPRMKLPSIISSLKDISQE